MPEIRTGVWTTDQMALDMLAARAPALVRQCADAIGIPTRDWFGRCYEIAGLILDYTDVIDSPIEGLFAGATRVYGAWTEPVNPGSLFLVQYTAGHVQHGWLVLPDGTIVDPTRWCFEDAEPYVYIGAADHYEGALWDGGPA